MTEEEKEERSRRSIEQVETLVLGAWTPYYSYDGTRGPSQTPALVTAVLDNHGETMLALTMTHGGIVFRGFDNDSPYFRIKEACDLWIAKENVEAASCLLRQAQVVPWKGRWGA